MPQSISWNTTGTEKKKKINKHHFLFSKTTSLVRFVSCVINPKRRKQTTKSSLYLFRNRTDGDFMCSFAAFGQNNTNIHPKGKHKMICTGEGWTGSHFRGKLHSQHAADVCWMWYTSTTYICRIPCLYVWICVMHPLPHLFCIILLMTPPGLSVYPYVTPHLSLSMFTLQIHPKQP